MDEICHLMNTNEYHAQSAISFDAIPWVAADGHHVDIEPDEHAKKDQYCQPGDKNSKSLKEIEGRKLTEYMEYCRQWDIEKEEEEIARDRRDRERRNEEQREEEQRIANESKRASSWRWDMNHLLRLARET